jgi:divalent anion:Na+ symporter, DASS family
MSAEASSRGWAGAHPFRLLIAVGAGVLIALLPAPAELEPRAWRLLAIFVGTVVGIVARPLPMAATALIGLTVAACTGTLKVAPVLSGFGNPSIWLVVCAFLFAGTFIRTGLGARIAYLFTTMFGHRTLGLGYSLAFTDLVLAPFIPSHTARTGGAVFPVLQSILRSSFGPPDGAAARTTGAFLAMAIYQASISTSGVFLTSMVGNPLAAEFAGQQGIAISWGSWLAASIVPGLVSLVIVPAVVYLIYPPAIRHTPEARQLAREKLDELGPMKREEKILVFAFLALLGAWAFGEMVGIENTAAALGAVSVLLLTGVMKWEHIAHDHEAWTTFVWFAVLLMMATQLGALGVPKWFGQSVTAAVGEVNWVVGFLVLSVAYFYSHYFFASNTAHISAMYAPFLIIAIGLGTPPMLAALTLAFFSNLFACLTHYGAAAAPIFFSAGYIPVSTWWKVGFVVSLVNIPIWLVIGGLWWKLLGYW